MNSIFLIFKNQFIKFIYLFFILFLFSCAHSDSISFSSPSINGLSKSLKIYQKMIYAEEYVFLLETFYLKEHQEQINNRYENNLLKWLEKSEVSKLLINSSSTVKKYSPNLRAKLSRKLFLPVIDISILGASKNSAD